MIFYIRFQWHKFWASYYLKKSHKEPSMNKRWMTYTKKSMEHSNIILDMVMRDAK